MTKIKVCVMHSHTRWDVTAGDGRGSPRPSLQGRTVGAGRWKPSQCGWHTCQQRPPDPSAALPNTGWRMTNRVPRGSRETREKKEKKQLSALAQSWIYNMSRKACIRQSNVCVLLSLTDKISNLNRSSVWLLNSQVFWVSYGRRQG